jgi:predicted  nucleic acid-binding Zn-ribbon protein
MQKVIELLKGLMSQLEADGKEEAAQYDKYACFCKEQADEKLYSIEKSDARIADLKATITALETSIALLNSEISGLSKKITGLEQDIEDETEHRAMMHSEYQAKSKDMMEAIEACGAAIEALKDSKKAMKGAKLDLQQVQKVSKAFAVISKQNVTSANPRATALLERLQLRGNAAPKFEYQSNDIIATLEELLATFKSMKNNLDETEFKEQAEHDSIVLGWENEKQFANKDKAEKESIVASKEEDKNQAMNDKDQEQKDRNADNEFMGKMTSDCQEKAQLWDQRSKARADELHALQEATDLLVKGAASHYKAVWEEAGSHGVSFVKKAAGAPQKSPSFLQLEDVQYGEARKELAIEKVLLHLQAASMRTGSNRLATVATRVKLQEDHFVKVRSLIKDIIARLVAQARAEASTKSYCDQAMKKEITSRDDANHNIEAAKAKITTSQARIEALMAMIAEDTKEIADLQKSLAEAAEMRQADSAEHYKIQQETLAGANACRHAMYVLQQFYGCKGTCMEDYGDGQYGVTAKSALVQKYVPPNSDRDGNTVGDLSPDIFKKEYAGAHENSKGIFGILEVLISDFERTTQAVNSEEEESVRAYIEITMVTEMDVGEHKAAIVMNEGLLAEAKGNLLEGQGEMGDAKKMLENSESKLDALRKMCVEGEETWEERKSKREEEIEALKDALDILENWQS